jgi:serine/threonine-protein kinase
VLRGDLDAVVLCALHKDPLARYATAELLCQDIERWLRGEPVAVRGHAFGSRIRSFLRRRLRVVAATAASLLLVAGVTMLYTGRLSRERDRARVEAEKAEQISSFIVQVFEGASPEQVQGRQVTARQLLDLGARQIGSDLEGRSWTQAEMSLLFAELNCRMGAPERAVPLLEQALDLARSSGASAEWKAQVMLRLARLYRARGEAARADLLLAHAQMLTARVPILDQAVIRTALTGSAEPRAGHGRAGHGRAEDPAIRTSAPVQALGRGTSTPGETESRPGPRP